jgi:hypothetical protein
MFILWIITGVMPGGAQDMSSPGATWSIPPDPGCLVTDAWSGQGNPRTDVVGIRNHALPDWNATYWGTYLEQSLGTVVTVHGRFPKARYVSFQVYDLATTVLGGLNDQEIDPDPGQNNPFRGGVTQGTFTIRMVFGFPPAVPPPNTFYTFGLTAVILMYRVYIPENPNDITGGTYDPVLPTITLEGEGKRTLATCAPRPILIPEELTSNGRLNDIDFVGTVPFLPIPAFKPPLWGFQITNPFIPFFSSRDSSYMYTLISRGYLMPPYKFNMAVIHMRAPTFPDTRAGVPPNTNADVRFWSFCQNELITTSVVRCVTDREAANPTGWATIVISDPSFRPSDAVLRQWNAAWMPWGALQPNDVIYDLLGLPLTNANGVFYYGFILYRQILANKLYSQSIENIAKLAIWDRRAAMGDYWPSMGYCSAADFQTMGGNCINKNFDK